MHMKANKDNYICDAILRSQHLSIVYSSSTSKIILNVIYHTSVKWIENIPHALPCANACTHGIISATEHMSRIKFLVVWTGIWEISWINPSIKMTSSFITIASCGRQNVSILLVLPLVHRTAIRSRIVVHLRKAAFFFVIRFQANSFWAFLYTNQYETEYHTFDLRC